jgi:hypothetical protein
MLLLPFRLYYCEGMLDRLVCQKGFYHRRISSAGAAVRLSSSKSSVKIALSKASGPRILLSLFFTLSSSGFALFGQSWVLRLNASDRLILFPGRYIILKLKPARNSNYRICF